jgi:hypothetical protein
MADRIPIYELHIKPLFRLIDQQHMLLFFDLFDYDAIKTNAALILQRLRGSMPPASTGGSWPPELVTMFERWVNAGCPRLALGTGSNYALSKGGTSYHLECNVVVPTNRSQAWLDIVDVDPTRRTYRLYFDRSGGGQELPTTLTVSDDFDETANITLVKVIDAAGTQNVALVGA